MMICKVDISGVDKKNIIDSILPALQRGTEPG
jgi:hypothetical protein